MIVGTQVYIAEKSGNHLGVFTDETKAKAACKQDYEDSYCCGARLCPGLTWNSHPSALDNSQTVYAAAGDHQQYWSYQITPYTVQ